MTDLDKLEAAFKASGLGPMVSVHIISPGYEHCANLCTRLKGHKSDYPVAMMQKEWADFIADSVNAFPAILAELRELRRAKEELEEVRKRMAESIEMRWEKGIRNAI